VIRLACVQHGPMHHDEHMGWWICSGFAGEGCLTAMIVPDMEADVALLFNGPPPPGTEFITEAA
jgi:hypothetical protein